MPTPLHTPISETSEEKRTQRSRGTRRDRREVSWREARPSPRPLRKLCVPRVEKTRTTVRSPTMFIGHYGVAFAAKPVRKPVPLWLLFLAVQWLDVIWSVLVMLGIEKLRIVKGFTEANAMDLYYMPYTHGLLGAVALSVMLGGIA